MKIKDEFIIREIAGDFLVIPTGKAAMEYHGLITVNEVGRFLWDQLRKEVTEEDLVKGLMEEYEVSEELARQDIDVFLKSLKDQGILAAD